MASQSPQAVFTFALNCALATIEFAYPHQVPRRPLIAYKVVMRMTRLRQYQQALRFISVSATMPFMGAAQSLHPKHNPHVIRFPSSYAVLPHFPPTQNVQCTDTTHEKQLHSVRGDPLTIDNMAKLQPVHHRLHRREKINRISKST